MSWQGGWLPTQLRIRLLAWPELDQTMSGAGTTTMVMVAVLDQPLVWARLTLKLFVPMS